jgi:opine dehydrogenase
MNEANYTTGYSKAPGFLGIRAQSQLDNRYLTEDVGYSMVFFTDLARALHVPTPTMDAVVHIASVILGRDFVAEGARTMATMGLADLTREELLAF